MQQSESGSYTKLSYYLYKNYIQNQSCGNGMGMIMKCTLRILDAN